VPDPLLRSAIARSTVSVAGTSIAGKLVAVRHPLKGDTVGAATEHYSPGHDSGWALDEPMSRRSFLKLTGMAVVTVAWAGLVTGVLTSCGDPGVPGLLPGAPPLPPAGPSSDDDSDSDEPPP
jgi:hypothetical protein